MTGSSSLQNGESSVRLGVGKMMTCKQCGKQINLQVFYRTSDDFEGCLPKAEILAISPMNNRSHRGCFILDVSGDEWMNQ